MVRRLAALVVASLLTSPVHAEVGRDDQWSFIPRDARSGPRAEFRADGDRPSEQLLFRFTCVRRGRVLVEYFPGEDFDSVSDDVKRAPLELTVADRTTLIPQRRTGDRLVGTLALSERILAEAAATGSVELYGPSEMNEPFFAGQAAPLRRLIKECGEGR